MIPARFNPRSARRGFSLLEVIVAMAIVAIVTVSLSTIFVMSNRFLVEGFHENTLRSQAAYFVERAKLALTYAFSNDSVVAADRPAINEGKTSISFTTPDDTGDNAVEHYTMALSGGNLMLTKNDSSEMLLKHVTDFFVDNQEGLIVFMATVKIQQPAGRKAIDRQFTIVGRALPRNMGRIAY